MAWKIEFKDTVAKDLKKIDPQNRTRILDYLHKRLAPLDDPRSLGAALKGSELGEFWRYRVGDYRIIAHIEDETVKILVVRIGNRKDIYR